MKKTLFRSIFYMIVTLCLVCVAMPAQAKVSAEEAERLKNELMPLGGIRAGNEAGTIPAWTGGLAKTPENVTFDVNSMERWPDPFANDKPLYKVTSQNLDQYRDLLSPGTQMLFEMSPDFEMWVFPTRRSMATTQWVYDRTFENATRAEIEGRGVKGAFGGAPFPIPNFNDKEAQPGLQLMYNHQLMSRSAAKSDITHWITVGPGGAVPGGKNLNYWGFPYLYADKDLEWYEENQPPFGQLLRVTLSPPASKGGMGVVHRTIMYDTGGKDASWSYSPGARRVRRSPTTAFDTPAGLGTMCDIHNYNGDPVRFIWNYIESKEALVPYNMYAFDLASIEEIMTPKFPNPKYVRWELHRVHVYEAVLKSDSRHLYGRRVWYQDEDSWLNLIQDKYDTRGVLWRVGYEKNYVAYGDWPEEFTKRNPAPYIYNRGGILFDNQVNYYEITYAVNGIEKPFNRVEDIKIQQYPQDWFSPQYLRRKGRR